MFGRGWRLSARRNATAATDDSSDGSWTANMRGRYRRREAEESADELTVIARGRAESELLTSLHPGGQALNQKRKPLDQATATGVDDTIVIRAFDDVQLVTELPRRNSWVTILAVEHVLTWISGRASSISTTRSPDRTTAQSRRRRVTPSEPGRESLMAPWSP